MINNVAQAIIDNLEVEGECLISLGTIDNMGKAAIAAMREPSEKFKSQIEDIIRDAAVDFRDGEALSEIGVYQALIDAALEKENE